MRKSLRAAIGKEARILRRNAPKSFQKWLFATIKERL
jgi:hypothetical protein